MWSKVRVGYGGAFSKWIELVALPQDSTELSATTFLDRMLARFGASAEVLMDQRR